MSGTGQEISTNALFTFVADGSMKIPLSVDVRGERKDDGSMGWILSATSIKCPSSIVSDKRRTERSS